jgi:hypothetical protein
MQMMCKMNSKGTANVGITLSGSTVMGLVGIPCGISQAVAPRVTAVKRELAWPKCGGGCEPALRGTKNRTPKVSCFSRPGFWPTPQAERETLASRYFIDEKSVGRM